MTVDNKNVKKELIQYLLSKVKGRELDPELVKEFINELRKQPKNENEPIALVGMACRYPDAEDINQFWDNLADGRQSITSFPLNRLEDFKRIKKIAGHLRRGGFLDSIDEFDAEYFNIPPKVAVHMDPYHRLMLEIFVETIEDAGYHRGQLQGCSVGVFVGNDHTHRLNMSYMPFISEPDFTTITGSWSGVLASRLSYLLNLHGPAVVLDAGCSSSLVALDYAIKAIRQGDCEAALVGSANIFLDPVNFDSETQSSEYVVRAFDHDANGTVWSEGVGAVYIKPLSKAQADGDHIYGIIKGIATNNDGKSNGLTAPSAKAQQEVLLKAWERSGISPETITYIETHGTGTTLGDPIEIKGLTGAFSKYTNKRQFCAIGSVKSNIGHTVGSAGMASLIKVLLCLRERVLPPSINFKVPNPLIDFCNSPVYIQDCLTPWEPENAPRCAAISSFSLSGTNCHLVIEEAPADNRAASKKEMGIYVLSGRTLELLKKTVLRHLKYVQRHQNMRLEDMCYTACIGREHHKVRAAVFCNDIRTLTEGLKDLADALSTEETDIHTLHEEKEYSSIWLSPQTSSSTQFNLGGTDLEAETKSILSKLLNSDLRETRSYWERLAQLYVYGAEINFDGIFANRDVKRISIPPQIFNNKRYWDETLRNLDEEQYGSNGTEQDKTVDAVSLWTEVCSKGSRLPSDYEPSSKVEELLAWLWSETLGYPIIKPTDDFYQMGGDSVNAFKIIQVLNMAFGMEIPPSSLLGFPVFSDFVRTICTDFGFTETVLKSKLTIATKEKPLQTNDADRVSIPLSPAQTRIFLSVGMMPDSIAYNVTGVARIEGKEDIDVAESLMRRLIDRHESLRTSFSLENGKPIQVIHSKVEFAVERRKLDYVDDEKIRRKHLEAELKDFVRPFDLKNAPLLRVGYFEFDDKETYLAIDLHHIITDGASMGLLFAEYMALAEGRNLAPLIMGYRDAVEWLRNRLDEPSLIRQRKWWLEQFSDKIPLLDIHTDKPRPLVRDYRGARVFHTIPVTLTTRLKSLARNSGTTLFTVLMAIFHNLLAKLGGGRDIVIGTPVTGRSRLELQSIVGMFVNTLPIRTISTDEESFFELIERLKTTVMEAFDNQEYPYEALIEELKLERNLGRNPLFDVYFALQNVDMGMSGSGEKFIEFDSGTAKFDLTVSARETSDGLLMEWEYAEALFNHLTIERMAKRFQRLISSVLENPSRKLCDLDIMEEGEKVLILEELNNTTTEYPGHCGIVALFEECVSKFGRKTALIMETKCMSYQELNTQANTIAREIQSRGVVPGSGVALLLQRSFDMITAIFGVLKAGCYYIPLDTESPVDRLITMMEDGGAKLLITHGNVEHPLKEGKLEEALVLDLDLLNPQSENNNLNIESDGNDPAYIVYTSGSTGNPKGALIRQKSVIRVVRDAGYINICPEDVLLQLSNYSFDGSVFDIFGALLNGASLVLVNRDEVTNPKALGKLIHDSNVSVFFITTALFNALVDANLECLDSTRKILFGGEMASVHHVRKAYERLGVGRLIHVYGPTETTVFATAYSIDTCPKDEGVPIGRAIGNTTLYVLDDSMRLQPLGVPGELYIGGSGLAAGYINKPEITKECFVDNPFKTGELLYKSGDLVVWGEGNFVQFIGRRDQQVKLRGYRIELGEIEAVSLKMDSVKKAHAGVHTDEHGISNLCLWVVTDTSTDTFDVQALRQTLANTLPAYMVPTFIVPIDVLPLNKNGKIDKASLPAPLSMIRNEIREPRNRRETLLVDIWEQVLGVSKPSIDDNFFALGGDSIKAIQVVSRLQNMNLTAETQDVFLYQTIETLAPQLIDQHCMDAEQGYVFGPCAPNAIQAWFLSTGFKPEKRFNQAMLITGNMHWKDTELGNALSRLCHHHDALRLTVSSDGTMTIRGAEEGNLYYLCCLSPNLTAKAMNDEFIEIQKHINLETGPLVAAAVCQDSEGTKLFISIHHMAVDVVSWGVIFEDLCSCLANPDANLPRKTTSFLSWTQALTEWAQSGGARGQLPYWRKMAKEILGLPQPFTPASVLRQDTVRAEHLIGGDIGRSLCSSANFAYNTETFHLLLTVFSRALCKWTGVKALLVNLEGHGRENFIHGVDASRTVGWFTSTYPVLLVAGGEVEDAVKSVKEAVREVPEKGFGFGVLRWLDGGLSDEDKALLGSLQPCINFNYLGMQQDTYSGDISMKALPAEITVDEEYESNWVLDIVASQVDSVLSLEIRYPCALYSEEVLAGFLEQLDNTANEIVMHCAGKTSGEKTASDFTVTKLRQEDLENILDDLSIE